MIYTYIYVCVSVYVCLFMYVCVYVCALGWLRVGEIRRADRQATRRHRRTTTKRANFDRVMVRLSDSLFALAFIIIFSTLTFELVENGWLSS